jgi:cation diffusion facilitator CzcD-associated flavoprotein CzcO
MLDWLILGGGIHGVHIAARLIGEAGVPPQRLRILDPGASLLERWRTCTAATGMSHLRSPSVHHLDLAASSLDRFAGTPRRRGVGLFAPPYDRPSLALFNAHCDHVMSRYELASLQVRGRAVRISLGSDRVEVRTDAGCTLSSARAVLAIGTSDQPAWPPWAANGEDPRIRHIFAPGFVLDEGIRRKKIVVVGGGISAAQIALWLTSEKGPVHLVSRHEPRMHQFDSNPGWLGPRLMHGFEREKRPERRRALIAGARHRGSMPSDVFAALGRAIDEGRVHWHLAEVRGLHRASATLSMRLSSGPDIFADQVLLATGFQAKRPGGPLIDELIEEASLPCAACGYPLVDKFLRWHPLVFTTGPMAELEIGPAARNIVGARRAADRILGSRLPRV